MRKYRDTSYNLDFVKKLIEAKIQIDAWETYSLFHIQKLTALNILSCKIQLVLDVENISLILL